MKVGKPKSKRVPVRLRHKIEKASAAKQRKNRKEAKKNPQWRSRLKKDPGVPNLFPYKAKMLAELEEQKRLKVEEQQRKRDLAKAQREGKSVAEVQAAQAARKDVDESDEALLDDTEGMEEGDEMEDQRNSNPMAALLALAQARAQTFDSDDEDDEDEVDEEEAEEVIHNAKAPTVSEKQGLPKKALEDPIKAVSLLIDRMQRTENGMQRLLDYYGIPPLVTAGSDLNTRFLVEVARKRGRLGRGGVPNLHTAALTVLGDLNQQRLVLPAEQKRKAKPSGTSEVQVVQNLAEPFKIEGLWGSETSTQETEDMVET